MNCGFEDVRILSSYIPDLTSATPAPAPDVDLTKAFDEYTRSRHPALLAICDLALRNHHEMSSKVRDPLFLLRRKVDALLATVFRGGWLPLYEMVTFRPDIGYDEAVRRSKAQDGIVEGVVRFVGGMGVGLGLLAAGLTVSGYWRSLYRR